MNYQPSANVQTQSTYTPTESQQARAAALKRFNWLYVYTPIILGSLVLLLLIVLMFWGIFSPSAAENRHFLSGLADLVLIFIAAPMTLLCAIGPLALIGLIAYPIQQRRQRQEAGLDPPPGSRLQILIWRLDALLNTIYDKVETYAPRVARPVIAFNAMLAYIESWLARLKSIFTRS